MSKYIDAEKLIAEIARLYKQNTCDFDNGCNEDQCYGYGIALSDLQIIIDSLQQEQPDENLDEAARDYGVRGNANGVGGEDYAHDLEIAYKAGAVCQKSQMLKDAVEGYITFNRDAQIEGLPCVTVFAKEKSLKFYKSRGFELGDKVRIIIVKED